MTEIPAAAHDAARSEARRMLAGLLPGQTGLNLADEVADAVLGAALPAIIAAYEKQKTAHTDTARIERGTLINCDFGGCNQCEWDALAEGRGWERHAALGKWYCPTHKATIVGES